MNNYTLLHPVDFYRLTLDNSEEYILYSKISEKLPCVEIQGKPLSTYRHFRLNGVLYIECRFKENGEFLIKENQPVVKPVPLTFNELLNLLKPHITISDGTITEITIHATCNGLCNIGIDRYSFTDQKYNAEITYLVKEQK